VLLGRDTSSSESGFDPDHLDETKQNGKDSLLAIRIFTASVAGKRVRRQAASPTTAAVATNKHRSAKNATSTVLAITAATPSAANVNMLKVS
jgi:hypothetical protein